MYKHALKAHKAFKSKTEKTLIIGGKDDFCAERYGYNREINGISPCLYYKKLSPTVNCASVLYTEYMPLNGQVVFSTTSGLLYGWNPTTKGATRYLGILTVNYPCGHSCIIDGVNTHLFVSGNWMSKIDETGTAKPVNITVKLLSTVMHCGRLFGADATDRYMLRWSGYAINDWKEGADNAGYAHLNPRLGKLLNLFVLGEKIVIVRERGITILSTLGDSRHMRLDVCDKHVLEGVYENSSVICGGQLWIYTKKGMYTFNGSTVSKAPFDEIMLDYVLDKPKVVDDRYIYYTALKDGVKYLFGYDTQTGAGNPFGKGCHGLFFTDEGAYCFSGNYLGDMLPDADDPDRFWVSKPFNFGEGKTATLKSLTLQGGGNFTVEIDCDGRKLYADGAGVFRFAECGQSFTFKVTGNGSVNSMNAEWEVRE